MINFLDKILILSKCRRNYSNFDRMFIANMENIKEEEKLTDKQKAQIDRLLYKYRRQYAPKNYLNASQESFVSHITNDVSKNEKGKFIIKINNIPFEDAKRSKIRQ